MDLTRRTVRAGADRDVANKERKPLRLEPTVGMDYVWHILAYLKLGLRREFPDPAVSECIRYRATSGYVESFQTEWYPKKSGGIR